MLYIIIAIVFVIGISLAEHNYDRASNVDKIGMKLGYGLMFVIATVVGGAILLLR